MLFVRRGSVVVRILPQLLLTFGISCAVVWAHGQLFHWKVTLTSTPFSLMGVALAIFLGFRINASYDRYWEARKLWGALLVEARNLTRQHMTLTAPDSDARPFVLGLIGFVTVCRNQLRNRPLDTDLEALLPPDLVREIRGAQFPAVLVLLQLGRLLRDCRAAGHLELLFAQHMEGGLDRLSAALAGCERIANTPLPFTYSVILHRTVYVYCILLPFGLIDSIGSMTPLVVAFVCYTFFALEALSDEIEEPFGTMSNDLPLDAMLAGVDANLREMLGETPPPAPLPDKNFILT
jgi:ion channel-forming bestrophin family protein